MNRERPEHLERDVHTCPLPSACVGCGFLFFGPEAESDPVIHPGGYCTACVRSGTAPERYRNGYRMALIDGENHEGHR